MARTNLSLRDRLRLFAVTTAVFALVIFNLGSIAKADTHLETANKAVKTAAELLESDNYYDRILGAGTLSDIGSLTALEVLEEFATGPDIVLSLIHISEPTRPY